MKIFAPACCCRLISPELSILQAATMLRTVENLVSFPDPTPKREKGLVYIEHFLGHTGNSMSCDCHDNSSFRHGNASTAAIVGYSEVSHDNHM